MNKFNLACTGLLLLISCGVTKPVPTSTSTPITPPFASPTAETAPPPTETSTPLPTTTPAPTGTATHLSVVERLEATVTADLLSCRYGPGPEYLYLYALRKGANVTLIGQTGGNNWAWVDGRNKCWVNAKFIEIQGDLHSLPVVYPEPARLPRSPYYPPTTVLSATRDNHAVTVDWVDVPVDPGDYEDEFMFNYIVEVWRCENGLLVFDPLATNESTITFIDEPGCDSPSRGQVYVQEKHGFAGPAAISWPPIEAVP